MTGQHWFSPGPDNEMGWHNMTCGHCNTKVAGRVVHSHSNEGEETIKLIECKACNKCSVWHLEGQKIIPGERIGSEIEGLPQTVKQAYNEARDCVATGAYTGTVLLCRKILMNVAIERGDKPGKKFAEYLDYLEKQQHITTSVKEWADKIRDFGNDSTHDIPAPDPKVAHAALMFTMQLLRIIYEMPLLAKKY